MLLRKGVKVAELDWKRAREIVMRQKNPQTKRQRKTRLEIGLMEDPDEKKEIETL